MIDTLEVTQDGAEIRLRFSVGPGVVAHAVWLRRVGTDEWTRLTGISSEGPWSTARIDLRGLPRSTTEDGVVHAVHVEVVSRLREGSPLALRLTTSPDLDTSEPVRGWVTVHHRPPLGRARHTSIGPLSEVNDEGTRVTAYPNASGVLAIAVDRALKPYGRIHVTRLTIVRGSLQMTGRVESRHGDVNAASLVLKGRTSGHRIVHALRLAPDAQRTRAGFGLRWYDVALSADCGSWLADPGFCDDTYDAWVQLTTAQHPDPFEVRLGHTRLLARYRTRPGWARHRQRAVAVTPYYTFKAKRTSFIVNTFEADTYAYLRRQVRVRHITRALNVGREVWLVGERPYKAQDTGYWFFRYLRLNHPEIEAYYVIERGSPERRNVDPLGNVVALGSKEHIRLTMLATRVVGSHHADFLFPLRTKEFNRTVRATRVFLQHGVMGTKWMASFYGRNVSGFETDLFIVSSEREREYIMRDFGYAADEIAITGLSRFDSLLAGDVPVNPRQILIMPTWRDWLQDAEAYRESEYHATWSALLHHPDLRGLVAEHQLEIVFCLHPNMQQYVALFEDAPARVIGQGEVDVQHLLKQSAMLITDYSSVGFDFGFLHKPIVYFQFDRERFLAPEGSHLDLDEELPGTVVRTDALVLAELRRGLAEGFTASPEHIRRAERFLSHHDLHSCERIFEATVRARRRHQPHRLLSHELVAAVPNHLRRHRLYFPVMRWMFALVKLLPADEGLVVFESGVGRQYADSPRYIYEELVAGRPDLTKVWASNRRLPITDPSTRVVQRLSPLYFWYLARAKYWVNNQSFPHYLVRRAEGVYLQTWHGTPLKKMLHDLEQVHGRDSGYVERATAAAQQWSVLTSPNAYTTQAMRSAFHYTGAVLELGYPRNDVLHRPDRDRLAARVRSRIGVRPDQRVVLYAPTFRDDQGSRGRFTFRLPFDLERVQRALGDDCVLLLRMHVLISTQVDVPAHLRDVVRDVSWYPEVQELLLASDVLVTDYSSLFFDYASLRRPIIFYAYDLADYRDALRGFYLDYATDLPGPIVETEDQLLDALGHVADWEPGFAGRQEAFVRRFSPMDDGHAAQRVVEAVFGPGPAWQGPTGGRGPSWQGVRPAAQAGSSGRTSA